MVSCSGIAPQRLLELQEKEDICLINKISRPFVLEKEDKDETYCTTHEKVLLSN